MLVKVTLQKLLTSIAFFAFIEEKSIYNYKISLIVLYSDARKGDIHLMLRSNRTRRSRENSNQEMRKNQVE